MLMERCFSGQSTIGYKMRVTSRFFLNNHVTGLPWEVLSLIINPWNFRDFFTNKSGGD